MGIEGHIAPFAVHSVSLQTANRPKERTSHAVKQLIVGITNLRLGDSHLELRLANGIGPVAAQP